MRYVVLAALAITGVASAQTSVVVPSHNDKQDPALCFACPKSYNFPFFGHATAANRQGRALFMYDTADIPAVAMNIKALQVRPASVSVTPSATFNISVDVSVSPTAHTAISTTYANNHGTNKVNVFAGNVSLPSRSAGKWPRPWEAPVIFKAPFPYARPAGKSLVIEIKSTSATAAASWNIEGGTAEAGTRTSVASPALCLFAENPPRRPGSMNIHYPRQGMRWWMRYLRYPHNTPSFKTSVLVVGTVQNTRRISSLGLPPSSPGCVLASNIAATIPMIYRTSATPTRGTVEIPRILIPVNTAFGNQVIYSQPVCLDTDAITKQLKIHSGWANKHRIGTEIGPAASKVSRTGANAVNNATGGVVVKQAVTFRLVQ